MLSRWPIDHDRRVQRAPRRTTLLELVTGLTREGHTEHDVCDHVLELLETRRVVLTGILRDRGIRREELAR